jgi:GNAT superfamily N-acetyltransferase
MTTIIRRARPDEASLLTEIAHAAKRHWGYPEAWLARWRESLTFEPEFIAESPVYLAERDGVPVGCYALILGIPTAMLEHLWVRPEAMGRGVGRRLFEHAARTAAGSGARWLRLDSDPHAVGFYERLGARRIGEVAADMDGVRRALPRLIFEVGGPRC